MCNLQVKLCDPHLSALEVSFSRWGAIQMYVYLYLYLCALDQRTEWVCDYTRSAVLGAKCQPSSTKAWPTADAPWTTATRHQGRRGVRLGSSPTNVSRHRTDVLALGRVGPIRFTARLPSWRHWGLGRSQVADWCCIHTYRRSVLSVRWCL